MKGKLTVSKIFYAGISGKDFDYGKGLDDLIKADKSGDYIYDAGVRWKKFDYNKGLNALIKTDKSGRCIYSAGIYWKKFDYKKGLKILRMAKDKYLYRRALKDWPKGIKASLRASKKIKSKAKPMKDIGKTLKLENLLEYKQNKLLYPKSDLAARKIYLAAEQQEYFDYSKGLDDLIKADKSGKYICDAGIDWKEFDYEKGLDALIKKDKSGQYIYDAGQGWKNFDYKKGLDGLIKIDKAGEYIYYAGIYWKKLDYKKGLNALKNTEYYYKNALKDWPKNIEASQAKSKRIKSTAKKLPMKKRMLEDTKDFNELKTSYGIYSAGKKWKKFDYEKGLDELIKIDKSGFCIYKAGMDWKKFGFEKALKALKALKNIKWHKAALKYWPKGIKQNQAASKKIKSKAKPMKDIGKKYTIKEEKTMWLITYNNKEQYVETEEEVKIFTDKLKEKGIKFKVSKKERPKPDEGKSEIDNPDRVVDDKLKSSDKLVGEEREEEKYVQVQNPKSKLWKKIDKKKGMIVASSSKKFKGISVKKNIDESKKEKLSRKLNEFQAEIAGTNPAATVANIAFATGTGKRTYRAVKTEKGWAIKDDEKKLPPSTKAEVLDVLRYVGKNIKAFAKDDTSTWDIVSGGTGIEVIDDNGKRYNLAFRRK